MRNIGEKKEKKATIGNKRTGKKQNGKKLGQKKSEK